MTPLQFVTLYKDRKARIADNPNYAASVRNVVCTIEDLYNDSNFIMLKAVDSEQRYVIPMAGVILLNDDPLPLPG